MKKGNPYLYSLLFLLIVLNMLLVYQNISLKRASVKQDSPSAPQERYIPDLTLFNLKGEEVNLREIVIREQSKPTLLVFFSPTDCGACLSERTIWEKVAQENMAKVLTVASHPDLGELKTWLESADFRLPVLFDSTESAIEKLGIAATPLKVLTAPSGRVIWTDPARLTPEEQRNFWRDFGQALAMSN